LFIKNFDKHRSLNQDNLPGLVSGYKTWIWNAWKLQIAGSHFLASQSGKKIIWWSQKHCLILNFQILF